MKFAYILVLLSLVIVSCQSTSKKSVAEPQVSPITQEAYQAQVKSDKKKQAELDMPYRSMPNIKSLQLIAFARHTEQCNWEGIAKRDPDLMLVLERSESENQALRKIPEYRDVREKIPFMASCSDAENRTKSNFLKDWPYAQSMIPANQQGFYHSRLFGTKKTQTLVIVLDPGINDSHSSQWTWLSSELSKNIPLRIIVGSLAQHDKILSVIENAKAKNTLIISDVKQKKAIEKNTLAGKIPVYVISPETLTPEAADSNYGLIKINWSSRKALIEIRDKDDHQIQSTQLSF